MDEGGLPRCAALTRQLGEPPIGTASQIESFLLVEYAGPWPADVRDRVFTDCFGRSGVTRLTQLQHEHNLRALVIRRPGRQAKTGPPSVFVGGCRPGQRWLERLPIQRYTDLTHLDPAEITLGTGGFGEPVAGPLLLVCTHGRKDVCCAILGRPVADALAKAHPEHTWQCTHFGGDRWAGNLLVAPHGYMYGQLDPATALPIAAEALAGRMSVRQLRGRVGLNPFAQVAELAVRKHTGLRGLDDVLTEPPQPIDGTQVSVRVRTPDASFRVRVRRGVLTRHERSSCAGEATRYRFEVCAIESSVPV